MVRVGWIKTISGMAAVWVSAPAVAVTAMPVFPNAAAVLADKVTVCGAPLDRVKVAG